MKKNKGLIIFLIILLSVLAILVTLFMINALNEGISFNRFFSSDSVSDELVIDEIYDNIFKDIDIETDSGDIYIKESHDDKIKVLIYGEEDKIEINHDDTKLSIEASAPNCYGFCFNIVIPKIEVYVPTNYANHIDIQSSYGDVEIGNIPNLILDVEADCGDIKIEELSLNEDSKIREDLGDVTIGKTNSIYIDANTDVGEINIANNDKKSDITLTIKSDVGDIVVKN